MSPSESTPNLSLSAGVTALVVAFLTGIPLVVPQGEGMSLSLQYTAVLLGWQFFLAAVFVPLAVSLPGHFDSIIGLFAVVVCPSLALLVGGEMGGSQWGAVQFSLLAFSLFLAFLGGVFSHRGAAFLLSSGVGVALLSTVILANVLMDTPAQPTTIVSWILDTNPLPAAMHTGLGWDFFRMSLMYEFSRVSDFPFTYPTAWEVGWRYARGTCFTGGVFLVVRTWRGRGNTEEEGVEKE